MRYFHTSNTHTQQLTQNTEQAIQQFLPTLNQYLKYANHFGLFGPTARGQGMYIDDSLHSDFDFFLITNHINPRQAKKIKKIFQKTFAGLDASLLFFPPKAFDQPDLMIYELTHSHQLYRTNPNQKTSLKLTPLHRISRFECLRNLIYRSAYFLKLCQVDQQEKLTINPTIKHNDIMYAYSKVIFAIEECGLLLTRDYVADNHHRYQLAKSNKFLQKHKTFQTEHKRMYARRYQSSQKKQASTRRTISQTHHHQYDTTHGICLQHDLPRIPRSGYNRSPKETKTTQCIRNITIWNTHLLHPQPAIQS